MKSRFITAFGMTVILLVLIISNNNHIMRSFAEPVDMYSSEFTNAADFKGKRVKGAIPFSAGECVEITTTTTIRGFKTKEKSHYYAIPVNGENPEYYYYICAEVKEDRKYVFDILTENFIDNTTGHYTVEGSIKKIDNDTYEYMLDYFCELYPDMTRSELKQYVLPYCFYPETYDNVKTWIIIDSIALVLTVIFWIIFIIGLFKPSRARTRTIVDNSTYEYQTPIEIVTAARNASDCDVRNNYTYNNGAFSYENDVRPSNDSNPTPEGEVIVIDDVSYSKEELSTVTQLLNNGEKGKALLELKRITNFDLATASRVLDNWNSYFTY